MSGLAARILTVEDDPIVQADLRLVLEDAGFDLCPEARDGVEAVDMAREYRPDLVLIDLGLPRMDGVEATRRILRERHVPIVALTGRSRGEVIESALAAGAVGHVLKPFLAHQLVDTVSEALANSSRQVSNDAGAASERDQYRRIAAVESMLRDGYSGGAIAKRLREQFT